MDMSLGKLQEVVMDKEVCCGPWGRKVLDTTERLNWTELNWTENSEIEMAIIIVSLKSYHVKLSIEASYFGGRVNTV